MQNRWTTQVVKDSNGEILLELPTDLLAQLGWYEGIELFWDVNENGEVYIRDATCTSDGRGPDDSM